MKINDLSGALLDYWVARANGWTSNANPSAWVDDKGALCFIPAVCYDPSTDWALGGPIIERERIHLEPFPGGDEYPEWMAFEQSDGWGEPLDDSPRRQCGSTALEAAMRAYVASKFGAEVPDV